jgi:hypothetical protein
VSEGPSAWLVSGIVGVSVGALGLATGIVAGVVALDQQAALEASCPTRICDPADQRLVDNGDTAALISTIGFVVGGVSVAAGISLLVYDLVREDDTTVAITLNPSGVALHGAF